MHSIRRPNDLYTRAQSFVGKLVRDTYGRVGEVNVATVQGNGAIILHVTDVFTDARYVTTNEYATIIKD